MEDWSKGLIEGLETTVMEVEKFLISVGEDFNEVVDGFTQFSQEISGEIQKNLDELEEYFNEILEPIIDPILDIYLDFDLDFDEENPPPPPTMITYIHPSETEYSACRGCCHYHGHVYNGNILVCAMHPLGVETETCPDWES